MEFTALPRRSKDRFAPAFFNARLSQRIVSSCSSSVARYAFSITLRIFMSPSVDTLAYHLVGITNVLVDSPAIFRKSPGHRGAGHADLEQGSYKGPRRWVIFFFDSGSLDWIRVRDLLFESQIHRSFVGKHVDVDSLLQRGRYYSQRGCRVGRLVRGIH